MLKNAEVLSEHLTFEIKFGKKETKKEDYESKYSKDAEVWILRTPPDNTLFIKQFFFNGLTKSILKSKQGYNKYITD